jgi:hypothetical protein
MQAKALTARETQAHPFGVGEEEGDRRSDEGVVAQGGTIKPRSY